MIRRLIRRLFSRRRTPATPSTNAHRTHWSGLRPSIERIGDMVTLTLRCSDEATAKALFERLAGHLHCGAIRFTMFDEPSDTKPPLDSSPADPSGISP